MDGPWVLTVILQQSVAFALHKCYLKKKSATLENLRERMKQIVRLKNRIQHYGWGDTDSIPQLLGQENPEGRPCAELWMGGHPDLPSYILSDISTDSGWQPLDRAIADAPEAFLGTQAARCFGPHLPFLFKVLAIAKPLSLQVHPDRKQALAGFAAENQQGIFRNAPERNYKDQNHKPECICALSTFYALNGFRSISTICHLLDLFGIEDIKEAADALHKEPDAEGLRRFFTELMTADDRKRAGIIKDTLAGAARHIEDPALYLLCQWIQTIHAHFPADIGVISPILLNLIRLEPGEALFLESGRIHSYLGGLGVELMANSDNVLRCGLTPKHVDLDELLKVMSFDPEPIRRLHPEPVSPIEERYRLSAEEFSLSVIRLISENRKEALSVNGPEILLCLEGAAEIEPGEKNMISLSRGESVFVPGSLKDYRISGIGTLYRASIPQKRNGEEARK